MSISIPKSIAVRPADTFKGDYGHVLVIGGSIGLTGAPALCALSCLRTGAGLVTLAVPKSVYLIVASKLTEVMVYPLPETAGGTLSTGAGTALKPLLAKADCVALGPGLSRNSTTVRAVWQLVAGVHLPIVLDADGINAFAGGARTKLARAKGTIVMTPHPGEMARLLGISVAEVQKNRGQLAKKTAKELKAVVVLKGHKTVVAHPSGKWYVNQTGNPGMATAGTGDLLTGMIAALIGQGLDPFAAAKAGVYLHGLAGDLAAKRVGQVGLIASDVLRTIPEAIRHAARK